MTAFTTVRDAIAATDPKLLALLDAARQRFDVKLRYVRLHIDGEWQHAGSLTLRDQSVAATQR